MLRPDGTVEYQSCLEVERVDIEVFLHLCEEIALNASGNRLFRRFPASNRMAPPPISHIQLSARAQRPFDSVLPLLSQRVRNCSDPVFVRAQVVLQVSPAKNSLARMCLAELGRNLPSVLLGCGVSEITAMR